MTASTVQNSGSIGVYANASSGGITQLNITNSTIRNNTYGGISVNKANGITLSGNTFTGNTGTAVGLTFASGTFNSLSNNSGSGNSTNGIALSGSFRQNTTLPVNPNFPFIIPGSFSINTGVTLTVPADSVVKLDGLMTILSVQGTLLAQGTATNPVYFTSLKDDSVGGDTNNDGSATTPAPGDWYYVSIDSTGVTNMTYAILRYGGAHWSSPWKTLNLYQNASATLDHVTISNSGGSGIYLSTTTGYTTSLTMTASIVENSSNTGIIADSSGGGAIQLSVTNSTIRNNSCGISVNGSGNTSISGSSIYGNNQCGVTGSSSNTVMAENNWWGSSSGPAPFGSGNGINYTTYTCGTPAKTCYRYYVDADPWLGKDTVVANRNAPSSSATTSAAEPVNVVFGNYTYQHTDLTVPSIGMPFSFQRSFNSSQASTGGSLGFGWTHNFAMTAITQTLGVSNTVVLTLEDGRQDSYTDNGNGTFTPPAGTFDILAQNAGLFTLTRKDQTKYNFNTSGKLATIVDKNYNTITINYSGNNIASITDTAGRTYAFTSDGSARITQISDPLGRTLSFGYDGSGNFATSTDPRGKMTTYTYDANHHITSITDANSHTFVQNTYDTNGRVVQQLDAKLDLTTFGYYTSTLRTIITDTLSHPTIYDYDTQYRVVDEIDALSQKLAYVYDANNNRIQVTDKRNNTTHYAYDGMGNTATITDTLSNIWQFVYNSHNDLLTKTDPLSRVTTNTYDAHDNLLTTTNISGTTTFGYNTQGLLTSVTDANSHTTTYGYNANGDRTSTTDPLSNVASATYDSGGRRLTQTDPLGHTTQFAYDANNNLSTITDPLGHTTTYTYDSVGNKSSLTDADGNTSQYAYDQKDELTTVTDAAGNHVSYTYDGVGNKTSMTDANSHITTYGYDVLNRLLTVTDPLSHTTTYGYDANDNKTSILDANGKTTTFTYDALNRLTKIQYPTTSAQFTYDGVGNRLTMVDPTGTTIYTYDGLDRLTRVQAPNGTEQYTYNAVGNRTTIVYPNSNVASYSYDSANRLTNVTDWASRTFTYSYDAANNRTGLSDPNGVSTSYGYDTLNRSTAITTTSPMSGTIFFAQYSLDNVGNRTQMVDSEGTTNYSYDTLYRLTGVSYPDATSTQYAYDAMGNRTTMTTTVSGVTSYAYDSADRLQTAGATSFTWDNNGNQLTKGTATYQYDVANRLTQVVTGGTTDQFTYDGDGKRSTKTVNGTATNYAYDSNSSLPVVLTETTSGSSTTYLYGADLLARYDNTGNPTYYHADGLGSVRAMSNDAGQSVATYNYDAFGVVRNSMGATSTFKFAGEQSDDEAGLIFLRARYYDGILGRFVSRDDSGGNTHTPQSLNRFVYAQNNPVGLKDPSGKFSLTDLMSLGQVKDSADQAKSLYDVAEQSTRDDTDYWAWLYAKKTMGRNPTQEEVQESKDMAISDIANLKSLNNLGSGTVKLLGNPIVNWLFPTKWKDSSNDPAYQEWLKGQSQGGEATDDSIPDSQAGDYGQVFRTTQTFGDLLKMGGSPGRGK